MHVEVWRCCLGVGFRAQGYVSYGLLRPYSGRGYLGSVWLLMNLFLFPLCVMVGFFQLNLRVMLTYSDCPAMMKMWQAS